MDLIDWRWTCFAQRVHRIGYYFHCTYIITMALYINQIYLLKLDPKYADDKPELYLTETVTKKDAMLYLIAGLLCYPFIYDGSQLVKQGPFQYFAGFWNYVDIFHILGGFYNVYMQFTYGSKDVRTKCLMILLVMAMLFKLFFFFRIYQRFSVITTMIMTCMYDLKVFMLFFVILLVFLGNCLNVLNINPQDEYQDLNVMLRNIFNALRISVGDFDFT